MFPRKRKLHFKEFSYFTTCNEKDSTFTMSNTLRGIYTAFELLLPYWKCPVKNVKRRKQTSNLHGRSEECGHKSPTVKELLLHQVAENPILPTHKVSVVGLGQVGMACAVSLLTQNVTKQLVLIGRRKEKVRGEKQDLRHGTIHLKNAHVYAGTDFSASASSQLIVITAGARQKKGESRLALVQRNADIYKTMIPELVKHSPNCILMIVTNPVDVMTYVAWKMSGLPCNRVIGSGTSLDSSRFRYFIGKRLGVQPSTVHSWVIGEHGDSSVPVWSGVNVAGVRLRELSPALGTSADKENWAEVHEKVVKSAYEVIQLKGYTSWAIGLTVSALVRSFLRNTEEINAVSIFAKGYHGIDKDVYLSLPCVLGRNGVSHVLRLQLTEEETCLLRKSADHIHEVQCSVKL